jgi:chemotaxis protein MotA
VSTIIGLVVVFGAVLGGYAMAGGAFGILIQPNEIVVIGGAALGALVISAPGKVMKRVTHAFKTGFKGRAPTKDDYLQLLKLLFQLFQLTRREGMLALEPHLSNPATSSIFKLYPTVMGREHVTTFLVEGLRQLVDGCEVDDLAQMLDADLETLHDEEAQPIALIKGTGDALPGLGIVAAVLGIIITMGHLDGGPEEIGHHVGAALVGTFLGILLCYGVIGPIATAAEIQNAASGRFLVCIKEALIAAARGVNPNISIEFARRSIFTDERPSSAELEPAFKALKGGGGAALKEAA